MSNRFKMRLIILMLPPILAGSAELNSLNQGSTGKTGILSKDRIIQITYERNPMIAAARHKLESANCNFKLFEREYSQFIPFKMQSHISSAAGRIDNATTGSASVGIQKDFFNGSSVGFDAGTEILHQSGFRESTHFVRTNFEFPLFSSNKKLSRIIKRTYEENELFDAQLSYIEEIRDVVRRSLEMYYDLISRTQTLDAIRRHEGILNDLLKKPYLVDRSMDGQQVRNELSTVLADIETWTIEVNSLKWELQKQLHVDDINDFLIETIPLNFDSTHYYDEEYIKDGYESVLEKAIRNDNEIKVMIKTMRAAEEKKTLVNRGKWDILFMGELRHNYQTQSGFAGSDDYSSAGAGLELRRFDKKTLDYTRLKTEADIQGIQAQIEARQTDVASQIKREKAATESNCVIYQAKCRNAVSRWIMYQSKMENYLNGHETMDNLIQAFRSQMSTEIGQFEAYNDYLDNVRNLDHLCGVYFSKLGIEIK